jgi:hypothetical protein
LALDRATAKRVEWVSNELYGLRSRVRCELSCDQSNVPMLSRREAGWAPVDDAWLTTPRPSQRSDISCDFLHSWNTYGGPMDQNRRSVKSLASLLSLVLLLATPGCSGSSDDASRSGIVDCDSGRDTVVCISDIESIGSDAVSALGDADGGDPGAMSAGACALGTSDGGPWSICVVPIDDGQVVVGRDSGDGLSARAQIEGVDVEFSLDNVRGEATVLNGQATTFEVVDKGGATVGDLSGIALTASGS